MATSMTGPSAELGLIKKQRAVLRTTFTRLSNKVLEQLNSEEEDYCKLEADINLLNDKNDKLKTLNEESLTKLYETDADEETIEEEISSSDEYTTTYYTIKSKYDKFVRLADEKASSRSSSHQSSTNRHNADLLENSNARLKTKIKLPTIELVKFNGEIKNWLNFWSNFKKIHDSNDLSDEDKFQYLLQSTEPDSRARLIVVSYPPTAENYPKAIESLKARFGRDDLQTEVYVRELLNLTLSNFADRKPLSFLYDKIETQLRALDTLGVTSDKCAPLLYPLIESCLSENIIRAWQRSISISNDKPLDLKTKLDSLVNFLKSEVESEERIKLAVNGFESCKTKRQTKINDSYVSSQREREKPASAANLVNCKTPEKQRLDLLQTSKCVFCNGTHSNENCFKARKMTNEEKIDILKKNGYCYLCVKPSHIAKNCKAKLKCIICEKRHVPIMCSRKTETLSTEVKTEHSLSASSKSEVLLQTLSVNVKGENGLRRARVLIDTGSQRSYITKKLAHDLGYKPIHEEKLKHSLFGGFQSQVEQHMCYRVRLQSLNGDYACNFEVLDQNEICQSVPTAGIGYWMEELRQLGIEITDNYTGTIDVLIGADVAGKLLIDQHVILDSGIVAVGTHLGWTLMGRTNVKPSVNTSNPFESLMSTTLFVRDKAISQLWDLDILGIQDPVIKRSKIEEEVASHDFFEKTVAKDHDGRYKVSLLWKEGHPPLPSNANIALKRLDNTIKKLKENKLYNEYNKIFYEWERDNIIEEVKSFDNFKDKGHYLPHRPVIKDGSTTRIRPVFDASAREYNQPSLNDCLSTGANLIEKIPSILLGFRLDQIGVISDIKKAFLQIKLYENDKDFLRFLWMDNEGKIKIYRHNRVVFGVSCSPFLLGATINHHLRKYFDDRSLGEQAFINKLIHGFYVDNCVLSVSSEMELQSLIKEATDLFFEAKMELRGWEYTDKNLPLSTQPTPVLGMLWDKKEDNLFVNMANLNYDVSVEKITKRTILSTLNKIFDVIGVTAPVTIVPKIILQNLWTLKLKWDEEVTEEIRKSFLKWVKEIHFLKEIKFPRWLSGSKSSWSLHVFSDASKNAYGTVIFLRTETEFEVKLHFIGAKAKVAPLKSLSIPRLELLAANIGARLASSVKQKLEIPEFRVFYWSDSTTVLSWIQHEDCWSTFVWNRTKEIRELSLKGSWRYVPGPLNPADLTSRGCSAKELYNSGWWEGPSWLKSSPDEWPKNEFHGDEEDILKERKKGIITTLIHTQTRNSNWYYSYFNNYEKIIRMIGWILRFKHNCLQRSDKISGSLTVEEIENSEITIHKLIQQDSFVGVNDKRLASLCCFVDDKGLIRIKTKLTQRNDTDSFRAPVILPSMHPVVQFLIHDQHVRFCHAGVQSLLSILRERFWIINGRKTIRKVLRKCVTCLRHTSKSLEADPVCLPDDRVGDTAAFQVCGVDLAGPLLMKNNEKGWICLFTCAVVRAVHLELVSSLSTKEFIQAFRRFISRRGRPSVCYSDNGTNFVGTNNLLSQLDWDEISEFSTVQRIKWKFNPPASPWWGGWWERLIGLMKQILRKVLGTAYLSYEELYTVLCDCESLLNSRPLTYISEDPDDLVPLTPAMFLYEIRQNEVPDLDKIEQTDLNKRLRYRQKLKNDLRKRFRNEYLGMLTTKSKKLSRRLKKGEIVMVESENKKRLHWPLAIVEEVIPGKDEEIRLAKLRTKCGTILRPVQRIYPLEIQGDIEMEDMKTLYRNKSRDARLEEVETKQEVEKSTKIKTSRHGRPVHPPSRYKE